MKSDKSFSQYSRPLITSLLIGSGLLQLAAPVLAEGTPAGTTISNTATASYEDPSDPTKPLNTVSNTVEVKVAEVAGITVTADTFSITKATGNTAPGAEVGDTVKFVYNVTNVGNDTTKFHIPGTATTTGPGSVSVVEYERAPGDWQPISAGGSFESAPFAPGGVLKVRVVVTVLPGATANTPLTATLGKTVTPGQQNVARNADGGDVYTVDNVDGAPGEVNGAPENGVREASATQTVVIGATPQAFATVTKVRGAGTANSMSYTLGLKVANQIDVPASSNKIAADLAATEITLDNVPANKVLVSDAVPDGTTVGTLTPPNSDWKAVYTTDDTTTLAHKAKWQTVGTGGVPANAKRVGFIADGPIAKGTTVSGMIVNLNYKTDLANNGGKLANIAQLFGNTGVPGTTPGTVVPDKDKPVYDESGDNKPNNYNDDGTAPTPGPATNPLNITDGVANPNDPDVDGNNNNTGNGPGGEPNVFQVVPASQAGMLNGTANRPDAVGPTGNNDDFTNLSTAVPATTWVRDTDPASATFGQTLPKSLDPASVAFANTFKSATAGPVSLMPTTPATPLPDGTKVTITYGAAAKTFIYDATLAKFVNTDALGNKTGTPATPLVTPSIAANTPTNYGVEVDLPAGTAQLKGYGVPITAFVDTDNNGVPDATEPQNKTIDRVYTGYLKLEKQAQILGADGVEVIEDFTSNPQTLKNVAPNQMIKYKIVYTNISDVAPAGSGSVALNAQNIVVTEDGVQTATNPNSWYTKLGSATVVTTHRPNSAVDSNGGTITFGGKSNADPDISIYKDTIVGPLAPQTNGSFSFIRVVK